ELTSLGFSRRLGRPRRELLYAMSFLYWILAQGPREVRELQRLVESQDFSWETLERAKKCLGIVASKAGFRARGYWVWALPFPVAATDSIEVSERSCLAAA